MGSSCVSMIRLSVFVGGRSVRSAIYLALLLDSLVDLLEAFLSLLDFLTGGSSKVVLENR